MYLYMHIHVRLHDLFSMCAIFLSIHSQRKKLTKEGYKLIGSHSAVKLCRYGIREGGREGGRQAGREGGRE